MDAERSRKVRQSQRSIVTEKDPLPRGTYQIRYSCEGGWKSSIRIELKVSDPKTDCLSVQI